MQCVSITSELHASVTTVVVASCWGMLIGLVRTSDRSSNAFVAIWSIYKQPCWPEQKPSIIMLKRWMTVGSDEAAGKRSTLVLQNKLEPLG
ncbi:hypothetical protein CHARACLAT_021073 [Characodon lateralis]|uniref:Uncharacterized protein n=1 Tax=Characodon lateralis TaxID=208331 RepID=A0ABU7E578_9TELE|nr:hypothetical protein [Characodon lateralis]